MPIRKEEAATVLSRLIAESACVFAERDATDAASGAQAPVHRWGLGM